MKKSIMVLLTLITILCLIGCGTDTYGRPKDNPYYHCLFKVDSDASWHEVKISHNPYSSGIVAYTYDGIKIELQDYVQYTLGSCPEQKEH